MPTPLAANGSPIGGAALGASARGAGLVAVAVFLGALVLSSLGTPSVSQTVRARSTVPVATPTTRGTTRSTATTSTTMPSRPPADVKVLVLNGSGIKFAALRAAAVLRDAGYNVLAPDNAKTVATSMIEFAPGFDPDAASVAKLLTLPSADVVALTSPPPIADTRGAGVVVVVGPELAQSLPTVTVTTQAHATTATTKRAAVTVTTKARPPSTTVTTKSPSSTTTGSTP